MFPFFTKQKFSVFHAQHPNYGLSLLRAAMRLDFSFVCCVPMPCATHSAGLRELPPEPRYPRFSFTSRFLRAWASFQSRHPKCPHLLRHRPSSLLPQRLHSTAPNSPSSHHLSLSLALSEKKLSRQQTSCPLWKASHP